MTDRTTDERANAHHYLTDRFPQPGGGEVRWRIDEEQETCFRERGFCAGIDLLSSDQVVELRARLEALRDRITELEPDLYELERAWLERPDETVLHFLGAWRVDDLFHDLVFHPGVTIPVAQALGVERVRFWHDQVFWKPAHHPGVVPWHQDYAYWTRTGPPAHVTMFITLDDMGPENGGLEYVPGSHRWGLLPMSDFGGDIDALRSHLDADQLAAFRPEPIRLRAGQAALHHSHVVHGSRGNPSSSPRRAIVLNYMADGTVVLDGSAPLLRSTAPIASGSVVDGPCFPVVLDRIRSMSH